MDAEPFDSASLPDLDTCSDVELTAVLMRLQRVYLTASHVVAERDVVPDGCSQTTAAWWRDAALEYRRRVKVLTDPALPPRSPSTYATPKQRDRDPATARKRLR